MLAHRVIWKMATGSEPPCVDHINGNKDDNRLSNLRAATTSQNAMNSKRFRANNTSGVKGVILLKNGRWWASIVRDGKMISLKTFATKDEAAKARKRAEGELFGSFARAS